MNIFLTMVLVVVILIALLLIIAFFSKSTYTIQCERLIGHPRHVVFDYIRLLKNQDHYHKWVMLDPDMKKTFYGVDGYPGFIYEWDGNKKAGAGKQEIISINGEEVIMTKVSFERPFKGVAYSSVSLELAGENATMVKWQFSSKLNYPLNIMLLFMNMDKLLGKDIDESLNNLSNKLDDQRGQYWQKQKAI